MKRSNKYYDLQFIVECKLAGTEFYYPIAAFDCLSAAVEVVLAYREQIRPHDYRILQRQANGQFKSFDR